MVAQRMPKKMFMSLIWKCKLSGIAKHRHVSYLITVAMVIGLTQINRFPLTKLS